MTTLAAHLPDATRPDADAGREVLYQSATTRIYRLRLPTAAASVICKEPLGPNSLERLHHESGIIARLAGIEGVPRLAALPHLASVMALQDCAGVPLAQAIRTQALDLPALLTLALQLAQIVAAVHRCGVLHQNISPGNILLAGPQRLPVLIDFHLATTVAEGQPGLPHQHHIAGTLAYLAPEQTGRTGRTVDQRADLYALGATLYELATGRPPFEAQDPLQLIHDHLARLPTPPIALKPDLPPGLSDTLLRLLEKEPDRRYQSAEGLAHDLARLGQRLAQGDSAPFRLGTRDFALRLSPPSRLVGRTAEIGALRQAFGEVVQGQSRVVLVAGAPGVGKTALINELRPLAAAQRGWFVCGKFDQYRHEASTATTQALRALGRLLLAEPAAELALQRTRILQALGPNAGLACGLPEFALLLGPQPEVAFDPAQAEARLLQASLELLRAIVSTARPLVMVLDDLQWADPVSIRLIDHVLGDAHLPGLLLLGAYRSAEVDATHPLSALLPRWERLAAAPLQLPLQNLPRADLGALLVEMLRLEPAPAAKLADAVGANTHGNPFDTVELVNALRRDGALVPGNEGWHWDAATIRRYIGQGHVVDLLGTRIARLPPACQGLLQAMACLGGEVGLRLLQAATGLSSIVLQKQLAAPLEDGLLVLDHGADSSARFRHDRVQQAAYGALEPARRNRLHLAIARRLAACPEFSTAAAEQYLVAAAEVRDPDECRHVAGLLRTAAAQVRQSANYGALERFLRAALALLAHVGAQTEADQALRSALETEHHAALYSLGRLDEADGVYRAIEAHSSDALALVNPACVQVSSLSNRGRPREAVDLGLALLRRLGLEVPEEILASEIERQMDVLCQWVKDRSANEDQARADVNDPQVLGAARIINRLQPSAFFCDSMIVAWLVLESQRLWAGHGPCAALVAGLSRVTWVAIALRQDYRTGYDAVRHVLEVGVARGYEPETSQARHLFALSAAHWFEPLQDSIGQAQRAREGLLLGGDLQNVSFTYVTSIPVFLDCAPTLESYAAEIESGLAFATRTANHHACAMLLAHSQLLPALRCETEVPGSFGGADFDESAHLAQLGANKVALANFHIYRALAAALLDDAQDLGHHAGAAMPLLPAIRGLYPGALAYLLQALALAKGLKTAAPAERATLLAELDLCRDWLALRAADCPVNFLHLLKLVEAERATAVDDLWGAARAFDAALRELAAHQRPWQQALITERAGLFHLAHGMAHTGRTLLAEAQGLYQAWGASAKVRQLKQRYSFLRGAPVSGHERDPGQRASISADSIDTLAILRASQALSSETSLTRLKARVVELLGTLTGATTVRFTLWDEDAKDWFLSEQADAAPLGVEQAAARGLLPLSALRYAERTREALLVEDATHDDRFSHDPYLAGLERCSLLVVPILNQGVARAVLLLENQLSRGAFSSDRLDAVMLIAGQLAVSLENALLYEKLEQRVREQTRALRETQAELVATARQAGMAEIATNVLHNVGNILNSVNISAGLLSSTLRTSKAPGLTRAVQLMNEHAADLGDFLTRDDKGKMLPGYLNGLAQALAQEQQGMAQELEHLTRSIDHIKDVVARQQSYAGKGINLVESLQICELLEDALRINGDSLARHQITVVKEFSEVPVMLLDRAQVQQILVNLISNAKNAMENMAGGSRRITLSVDMVDEASLQVCVKDEGEGIQEENLTRIFAHGFTTRKEGHGFGLHSCALAARQMGGTLMAHSDGPGLGASFTLTLPINTTQAAP